MEVRWTKRAQLMVTEILDYTDQTFGTSQAKRLNSAFSRVNKYIKQFPRMGQIEPELDDFEGEYRYVMVNKLFKVIYLVESSELIYVIAVWNNRQSPNELRNIASNN